jgi:class 3 adenylate cyclase/pimeloyl-ACP methyl ester carboxylesterase
MFRTLFGSSTTSGAYRPVAMSCRPGKDAGVDHPKILYAKAPDGIHLAYQTLGDGPIDLVYMRGYVSNIELNWDNPGLARSLRRLASFSRLIVMDRRGTGCSDRLSPKDLPPLETQADDLRVVLDAVGSSRTALLGFDSGNILCTWFAATFPERTSALMLWGPNARGTIAPDWPWSWDDEEWDSYLDGIAEGWGTREHAEAFLRSSAPSDADDPGLLDWFDRYQRQAASPASALALESLSREYDLRAVLPSIHVPTLVMHHSEDPWEPVEAGRYVAEHIPGARFIELPAMSNPIVSLSDDELIEIEEFLTGARPALQPDRVLATVLFTDIVDSTGKAAGLGDEKWGELLAAHDERAKVEIERQRGRYIHGTGDGLLATLDGPARAVWCAQAIAESVRPLGIEIRAGVHTGEVELVGNDVRGIGVHIGARVAALAGPAEVLVSSTVKDLVAGSGLSFEDAGEHELKGVPDRWHLYRVIDGTPRT